MSDFKLGKKVDMSPRPVITPDWKPRPDLGPHIWQHKDGKLKNATPEPERVKTPAEEFYEMFGAINGPMTPEQIEALSYGYL